MNPTITHILITVAAGLLLWLLLGLLYSNRQLRRIGRVHDFELHLLGLACDVATARINAGHPDWEEPYRIIDTVTFEQLADSFKPLTLEAWFTPDQIKTLTEAER